MFCVRACVGIAVVVMEAVVVVVGAAVVVVGAAVVAQPKCGCTPAMCQEARRSKTTLKAAESSLAPRPFLRESACRLLALSPTLRGHWFCISVAQQASSVLLGPRLFERHSR